MKNWPLAAALVSVLVIALAALWFQGGDGGPAPNAQQQAALAVATGAQPETPAPTVPGRAVAEAPDTALPFAFRRLDIDSSRDAPEACLVFSRPLDPSGAVKYEDFLTIDPVTQTAARVIDQRLCLSGLAFGQTYQVTLKTGLPAQSGEKLQAPETVPVELSDRPALVSFTGGFILPRDAADGVPVSAVNVETLKLRVIRVGDRLLSQLETGLVDQATIWSYEEDQMADAQGSIVWEGEMPVAGARNQTVRALFPIRDVLKDRKPGVYLIVARNKADDDSTDPSRWWKGAASQWVLDTDMGLTTFAGTSGLDVFVRSLQTANPVSGVTFALIARNNNELARATADSNGRATFDPGLMRGTGGDEPVMVMAYGAEGDFAHLDLRRSAFDLSDRGVEGRNAPGPVDAFTFTERGIYRPGETVHLTAMLRDRTAAAVAQTNATVIVSRPDGMEWRRFPVNAQQAGTFTLAIPLTTTAARGRWQADVHLDPNAPAIGSAGFDVQDFVPQRLKVTVTPQAALVRPGETLALEVEGRFLYGAPASGIAGEGEVRIRPDTAPFAGFTDFAFGLVDERFEDQIVTLDVPAADEAGKTFATGMIPADLPQTSVPLKGMVRVALFEPGGRLTSEETTVPVRTRDVYLGIRADFADATVPENTEARFEAIAVDAEGRRIAVAGATYAFVREEVDYRWYRDPNGEWRWERIVRDRLLAQGNADLTADGFAKFAQRVEWGGYRLTVTDPVSGASSSVRFFGGWGGGASADRPDRVTISADKASYTAGETAVIAIRPPSDGKALVVVANEQVQEVMLIDAPASGADVRIPVKAEWGAGAYALVTHYRPLDSLQARAPVRAVGVAWLGVDQSARTLAVSFGTPQVVLPRQTLTVPVEVTGLAGESNGYVTVAAVDEGILQLTDYLTPDPAAHYFGKRRLGIAMRDDYGRLIQADRTLLGLLKTGGDGFGGTGLTVVPTRTVAMFSGPVALDASGKATVTLDIPDFVGELRLMAAAWTPTRVGRGEKPLTVRDPVVAELTLPRFLAPGDNAIASLNLHNVEGAAGTYQAVVKASGAVTPQGGRSITLEANLPLTQRTLLPVPLQGVEPGIATIQLDVTGPNGFAVTRSWPIEVRPPQVPQTVQEVAMIPAGQSNVLPAGALSGYLAGTASATVTVSASRSFADVPGMLKWLDRYPYGCLEQTTSRAYPLVFFNDMAKLAGLPEDQALKGRVQDAVDRVLDMQTSSGGFGMWSAYGSEADAYIGVFALDFLLAAKQNGYVVPDQAMARGREWLRTIAGSEGNNDLTRAYAFRVLTRTGAMNPGELRYFADTRLSGMTNPLAMGFTGAALSAIGDRARTNAAFARATDTISAVQPASYAAPDYGSLLRDVAGVTASAAEAGNAAALPPLLEKAALVQLAPDETTTQEKAWMLLAAHALRANAQPLSMTLEGAEGTAGPDGAIRFAPDAAALGQGITLRNGGQQTVWRTLTVQGVPASPLPAAQSGMQVTKTVFTMDGAIADLATLKQNDRVIVRLDGRVSGNLYREMVALDLLPAGLEIETTLSGEQGSIYPFLGTLSATDIAEARDDRFVAAFTVGSRWRDPDAVEPDPVFSVAYVARAVTPGQFVLPAASVEDMYAPAVRARTAMGQVTISAAQ